MIPVEDLPDRQVLARAGDALRPGDLCSVTTPLLRSADTLVFFGTALAAALATPLRQRGFKPVAATAPHPAVAEVAAEAPEYEAFAHGQGYTPSARALRQAIQRATRQFAPAEDRWPEDGRIVDPYRPGLIHAARSDREFEVQIDRHLNAVRSAIRRASVMIVALGSVEVVESTGDGAVFPYPPGAIAGAFDAEKHCVRTLTVEETVADLQAAIEAARSINPALRIVLMVSPEPMAVTQTRRHVLAASTLGKSILRVAMEQIAGRAGVSYIPALEIAATTPGVSYGGEAMVPARLVQAIASAIAEVSEGGSITFAADEEEQTPLATPEPEQPAAPVAEPEIVAARKRESVGLVAEAVDEYSSALAVEKARQEAKARERRANKLGVEDEEAAREAKARAAEEKARAAEEQREAKRREIEEKREAKARELEARRAEKAAAFEEKRAAKAREAEAQRVAKAQAMEEKREAKARELAAKRTAKAGDATSAQPAAEAAAAVVPLRKKRSALAGATLAEIPAAKTPATKAEAFQKKRAARLATRSGVEPGDDEAASKAKHPNVRLFEERRAAKLAAKAAVAPSVEDAKEAKGAKVRLFKERRAAKMAAKAERQRQEATGDPSASTIEEAAPAPPAQATSADPAPVKARSVAPGDDEARVRRAERRRARRADRSTARHPDSGE